MVLLTSYVSAIPILIAQGDQNDFKNPYNGENGAALWASEQTNGPLGTLPWSKENTSNRTVSISGISFVMLHWGNGGIDYPYQLWSFENCPVDEWTFTSPRSSGEGLSWVMTFGSREDREEVPDGGGTFVSLGLALLGLGSMRRFLANKA
jgi:hypothetical protein